MGWWTDIAIKHPGTPNHGGSMYQHRGVVIHIAQGSYSGTIAWQMNPDAEVSSHFIVSKGGEITQMLDTDVIAWTQGSGNGYWISVENEGYTPDELTPAQVDANAAIFAKSVQVYGHAMQVTNTPEGYGLGHHSMGAECGYDWGHSECPGGNIKAQKPTIVDIAKEGDVSAKDVWGYDVNNDPKASYSAQGALWVCFQRTDFLANNFAPGITAEIEEIQQTLAELKSTPTVGQTKTDDRTILTMMLVQAVITILVLAALVWVVVDHS